MFIAALVIIAKNGNTQMPININRRMNFKTVLCVILKHALYMTHKKIELVVHATTWMNGKDVTLS